MKNVHIVLFAGKIIDGELNNSNQSVEPPSNDSTEIPLAHDNSLESVAVPKDGDLFAVPKWSDGAKNTLQDILSMSKVPTPPASDIECSATEKERTSIFTMACLCGAKNCRKFLFF